VEAALARRDSPRRVAPGYRIDEPAEVERARRRKVPPPGTLVKAARAEIERDVRRRGERALHWLVDGKPDEQVERLIGSSLAQRALFTAMAQSYRPKMAFGFEGEIEYELTSGANGNAPAHWTIAVADGKASVRRGPAAEAAVTLRLSSADLLRLAAGANPGAMLLTGRTRVEGDLAVAMRLPEMFGAPSPY
jgi:putative sterol carrier protein